MPSFCNWKQVIPLRLLHSLRGFPCKTREADDSRQEDTTLFKDLLQKSLKVVKLCCSFVKLMIYKRSLDFFTIIFTMNKTVSLLTLLLVLTTAAEIQAPALHTSATIRTIGNVKVRTNSNSGCPIPHHELDLVQCDYKQVCVGVECFGRLCCYGRNYIPQGVNAQMVVFVTFPGPIYQVTQFLNTRSEARMTENDFQVHFDCPEGEICVFESDHQIETRDLNMKKE